MRDRILTYVAQGLKPVQVASIVGCTPAYINQLGKDPLFMEELKVEREKFQGNTDEDVVITNKYMALEHSILNAMENAMALAELPALTRALEVVATRQEKRAQRLTPSAPINNTVIVNLTLPSHAIPEYQVNSQKEVVSIGNRTVAPMSSVGVATLFQQMQAAKQQPQLIGAETSIPLMEVLGEF
jgi:hypothetical protein